MAADPTRDEENEGGGAKSPASGIPEVPQGTPTFDAAAADDGNARPMPNLPDLNFWDVLYGRRSIRKFDERPVDRALVEQVMHAGIWAPSSCNYQMWDLVAVTDPGVGATLAALSTQMANAPVNIVISYGRDFSEEAWANIQSASALIQNMSLAAHALGLGTFWITQTGGAEKVREAVGLPYDRMVIAVLALGWPKVVPKKGPKRRPLDQVTHFEHYAGRPIPSSTNPADWDGDLLTIYQRARVLNGLRHNKPRAWEQRAVLDAMDALVPEGKEKPAEGEARKHWLDVLPCTGIVTTKLSSTRKGFAFDVVERSKEVSDFCANRVSPKGTAFGWPDATDDLSEPEAGTYDVVTCIFRLEGLREEDRPELVRKMASWLKPGGKLVLGYVNAKSFHGLTEALRARGSGPKGVEYVLSPDPNIGPFEALTPRAIQELVQAAGGKIQGQFAAQAAPAPEEIEFRTRNMQGAFGKSVRAAAKVARTVDKVPGLSRARSRFQFVSVQFDRATSD